MSEEAATTQEAETTATTTPAIDPAQFAAMQESISKLEAKNRELLDEKKAAKAAAEAAALDAAKKGGDVEALEKSWSEKLATREQELTGELSQYQSMVQSMTAGAEAMRLASELAMPGHADVLLPHIQHRLVTEIKDGKPAVRVLDKDGKPSAMTVADLRKEIEGNKAFAPLLVGSMASGGGSINGGSATAKTLSRSQFDALSHGEKSKFGKEGGKIVDG